MERAEGPTTEQALAASAKDDIYLFGGVDDLRSVLNHLNAGVVAHAADTRIRVCNPMACELLGLTMDQMIGVAALDPQWMFLREDGSPMPLEEYPVSVVLGTRSVLKNLVVGVKRPALDDLVWVLCNGFPVLDEQGELQLAIITFIDITGRKQAEQEREKLEAQLRHAIKMEAIGRLAGGVAHDFNNILTTISGNAELAQMALGPRHPQQEELKAILQGSARAAELTRQLLSFARKQIIQPRVVQPNKILSQSEKMLRRLIGEDVELVFFPGRDLRNIRSDPGQIDQILVNLAVNARDAMPRGGRLSIETANVTLEDEPYPMGEGPVSGEFVMLAISDDGSGMDAATKEHIFEPFFSTKGAGEGTGLGLSTVYGIVRQNGGIIKVYSEPEQGTTFKIYFPAVLEEADPIAAPATGTVPRGSETILLVEDDVTVRELARKILSGHGYIVLEAAQADEAILLSQRFSGPIHLLLSDVVMPGINGRELAEQLKADRPQLEALFMSGYTENVIAHHGVLDEGTHFIQKPFTVRSLTLVVRELLDARLQ